MPRGATPTFFDDLLDSDELDMQDRASRGGDPGEEEAEENGEVEGPGSAMGGEKV